MLKRRYPHLGNRRKIYLENAVPLQITELQNIKKISQILVHVPFVEMCVANILRMVEEAAQVVGHSLDAP